MTGLSYAANLSMLWTDRDPYERFDAAAAAGFRRVEMLFPQRLDPAQVEARLDGNGLSLVLFDLHAGDWEAGERGIAALPDRTEEFRKHAFREIDLAARLGTRVLTVLAGRRAAGHDPVVCDRTLVENLRTLAPVAAERGIVLTVEAVNGTDVPGFHVRTIDHAASIVEEVGHDAVAVQFDQYHAVMEGDDPLALLDRHVAGVRHVQIADVPGRHEPGTGAAPVHAFLSRLAGHGYAGSVGLEYHPAGDTDAGLAWMR